jgi:folate-binding protein YgfZ
MVADDNQPMDRTPSPEAATGGACRLPQWGVIRAVGADAAAFLHGQLSNDVKGLGLTQARLAAFCSAQGRMLASLLVSRPAAEEYWLVCSADLLPATLKRLSMFVLRAKAKLTDASTELTALGLAGSAAAAALGAEAPATPWAKAARGDAQVIRLPDAEGQPRWLWLGPVAEADALLAQLPALDAARWQWLDVSSGIAPVVAATTGQFVPQMLNYELVGGVDFKKGCYPGQEVVARSQYLGKLKRRAFLLAGDAPAQPGQEVFWSGDAGQPAGQVASAATDAAGQAWRLIAELKTAATESGSLHLGSADGPALQLLPLPYALPQPPAAA